MVPKRFVFACLLCSLSLFSCSTAEEGAPAEPPADQEAGLNILTEAEKAAGWELLFDGKSLDKFRGYRMDSIPPGWEIQDGLLAFNADHGEEGYGDLITREQYASFELSLEWKITPCANSGILFHVSEESDQEWHTGPEYQIVDATEGCWSDYRAPDSERAPGSDLKFSQFSGANYDLHPPTRDAVKPVGEWNLTRLVVNGPHVEHWLNGEKVVEYELWSDEWKKLVAASKFNEYPDYGMKKTGHIVLQDHGKSLWFRNIKVKKL